MSRSTNPTAGPQPPRPGPDDDPDAFPIVAIGASAGGLAALKELFAHVPAQPGVAFVIVVHLSPEHESHLQALLQPHVKMPVQQVQRTIPIERDHVYVIPPNANLDAIDTHLRLTQLEGQRQRRAPIDHFFRTLAEAHDGHAIGIVLTGTGSDGTLGLRQIKGGGGLTIVQDPAEAEYDGMPRSAIASAPVDLVLRLSEIPDALLRYVRTEPRISVPMDGQDPDRDERVLLQKVFTQIRARTGRDFSHYKRSTLLRRISRRMQFNHLREPAEYLEFLRQKPDEVLTLADDLLITVTSFFRDAEVFDVLARDIIPQIFERKRDPKHSVRAWSVGCATGEEAYSLAILLLEEAAKRDAPAGIQVFASDLHPASLARAREGIYPGDIEADVPPDRLERFFQKQSGGGYRVRKEVREVVTFAPHDLLSDPPFSRIDLISCRNLLIYLQRGLQKHVAELFHYALARDGVVVLGTSETLDASELFVAEDKKRCIFRRRSVAAAEPRVPVFPLTSGRASDATAHTESTGDPLAYGQLHRELLERLGPPSVLVSPDDKLVHLSDHAGRYLVHRRRGAPTTNLFKLVPDALRVDLRAAVSAARKQGAPVRSQPIRVEAEGKPVAVVLDVKPVMDAEQAGFVLVTFDERPPEDAPVARPAPDEATATPESAGARELEERGRLEAIIEAYETSQEELKASNEELQSANEELRSTLEELETSKEELQSMNEELSTLNEENRHKVDELGQLSSDLQNLLVATDIATLFLDRELRISRFTPKIADLFNVTIADRGRALSDFTHHLLHADLQSDARRVLDHLVPIEREIEDEAGRWYLTRLLPYRDQQDRIAGVVVTFVEITEQKRGEDELRRAKQYAEDIIETLPEPLLVLDAAYCVQTANAAFYAHFRVAPEATRGRKIYDLGNGQWNIPALRELLEKVLPHDNVFNGYQVEHDFADLGHRVMLVNARRLDHVQLILLGIHDITERHDTEQALRASEGRSRMLALVANHSPDSIGVFDPEGLPIFVNVAGARLLGAELEQAERMRIEEHFVPEEQRLMRETVLPEVMHEGAWSGELHVRHIPTGASIPATASVFRIDDPVTAEPIAFAAITRDLVVQKRAEQAMRSQEARYRALAELSPEAILVDTAERFVFANEAAARLLGAEGVEDLVNGSPLRFLDRGCRAGVREQIRSVRETGRTSPRVVHHWQRTDGSTLQVEVVAGPTEWESEPAVQVVARDVTARERAQVELREANRHKDEHLAMLGHELRNPLAAMRSATELMKLSDPADPVLRRACGVLERQSTHMSRIIDGLLEVSRLARGKVALQTARIDVRDAVATVLEDRAPQVAARGLELDARPCAQPLWVEGDETRLVQVIDNLVGNAMKFTSPPGTITVSTRADDDSAVIRVRDTGVGIRREMLPRIFESFQQEVQDVDRSTGGLGLGLALAKGLVDLHHGTIAAASEGTGRGAEFEVRLPLRSPPAAERTMPRVAELVPMNILLVEDNADAAQMLADVLTLQGHRPRIAENGYKALEALRESRADIVLCDLGLPGMSGHDLARTIRGDSSLRTIPLVALTGYGQAEDRARSTAAGFDEHLVKPVGLDALNAVLARLAQGRP